MTRAILVPAGTRFAGTLITKAGAEMTAIVKILSFFVPLLFRGGDAQQKVQGATTSLLSAGAVSGAVMWLLGPGREWTVTLNAMELSAVGLGAAVLYEWARRSDPPAAPPQ